MPSDKQIVIDAVQSEARKLGILDPEMVNVLDLSAIKVLNGAVDPAAIKSVLDIAVHERAHFFVDPAKARLRLSDASKLSDADFVKLSDDIREATPPRPRTLPPELKRLDSSQLDDSEQWSLRMVLSGGGTAHDRGVVIMAARKQSIDLAFAEAY